MFSHQILTSILKRVSAIRRVRPTECTWQQYINHSSQIKVTKSEIFLNFSTILYLKLVTTSVKFIIPVVFFIRESCKTSYMYDHNTGN